MKHLINLFLKNINRFLSLSLAVVMLFNLSLEAAAQIASQPTTAQYVRNVPRSSVFGNTTNPKDYRTYMDEEDITDFRLHQAEYLMESTKVVQDNTRVVNRQLDIYLANKKLEEDNRAANEAAKGYMPYSNFKLLVREAFMEEGITPDQIEISTYHEFYNLHKQEVTTEDAAVTQVYKLFLAKEKEHFNNPDYLFNDASKKHFNDQLSKRNGGADEASDICVDNKCYEQYIFMRGALRFFMYRGTEEDKNIDKMLKEMGKISYIVMDFGVQHRDREFLVDYLLEVISKASHYCDNDLYRSDIFGSSIAGGGVQNQTKAYFHKQERQTSCGNVGSAITTLATLAEGGEITKSLAAVKTKNALYSSYKKDHGATIVVTAISALVFLDTHESYKYIEEFLTHKSIPSGNFGHEAGRVLDLLNINAYGRKGIDIANALRDGNGRYLNDNSSLYQYVSSETKTKLGLSSDKIALAESMPSLGYNIPYDNVLEDIGEMLGSLKNKKASALSKKLLKNYSAAHENKKNCLFKNRGQASFACDAGYLTHTPLAVGLLKTSQGKTAEGKKAANIIKDGHWWDISEATQRRINNIALNALGLPVKNTVDSKKRDLYKQNQKILVMSSYADLIVSAIFVGMLVASIPSMVKGVSGMITNASRVRAIGKAGRGNLLKSIRANIKASGVKPKQIKASIQTRQATQAVETRAAQLRAQRGIKTDGAGKPLPKQQAAPKAQTAQTAPTPKNAEIEITFSNKNFPESTITAKYKAQNGQFVSAQRTGAGTSSAGKPGQLQAESLSTNIGGSGAGGANTQKAMNLAEQAAWNKRVAADALTAEAKYSAEIAEMAAESQAALTKPSTFKPGFIINKPYNQLSPARKWLANQWINTQYNMGRVSESVGILAQNPKVSAMAGALPLGTTAEMVTITSVPVQTGIYASVGNQATTFNTVFNFNKTLASATQTASGGAATSLSAGNLLKAPSLPLMTMPQALSTATVNLVKMPQLFAVRHEWQGGGASGSANIKSGSLNNYVTPAQAESRPQANPLLPVPVSHYSNTLPDLHPAVTPRPQTETNPFTAPLLPADWALIQTQQAPSAVKLVAEVGQPEILPAGDPLLTHPIEAADPLITAAFSSLPLFTKLSGRITAGSTKKSADKFAKNVLAKKAPLPSQLVTIVKSKASDYYKKEALFILFSSGAFSTTLAGMPAETKEALTGDVSNPEDAESIKTALLGLFNGFVFENAIANVKDVTIPKQRQIAKEARAIVEQRKDVAFNENEQVEASLLDWGTGAIPFEKPKTNDDLIKAALKTPQYVIDNASEGVKTKKGIFYKDNIPVYYRDKDGSLSENPRILLSYSTAATKFSSFLSKLGLASKKGMTIPEGLVLAIDEEGKAKLVMPKGNLHTVESNAKAKKIALDNKETNRVAIDSEFTSSDLIEMAAILQADPDAAFEIDLNKPDSFSIFLTFHALFIGNDAGNTLTGQFKPYALDAGGNAFVNGVGGIGYATPFAGGALMGPLSKFGHVRTILLVYTFALMALGYSIFSGMTGFYNFPSDPTLKDFITLGIPTTVMVLGGSILNTTIQTLLNIYKDPVARSTAHLQYANNKNYSRLGVSAITGLALVSGLGLNWSIVIPAATLLLLVAGSLLFNTRIYENYKKEKAENKVKAAAEQEKNAKMTAAEKKQAEADAAKAKAALKEQRKGFHKVYKKELSKKEEMKSISRRVSKLYASYAASLLVLTQSFRLVAEGIGEGNLPTHALALGLLVAASVGIGAGYYLKPAQTVNDQLKKFIMPMVFFGTTLLTLFFADSPAAFSMALTTLALFTTTMMRVFSTELIKTKKATDDQLSGLSIPLIALMTSLLVFAPSSGNGLVLSLLAVLMLYAGTAVPGQLDSARMQNFISSEYKAKKNELTAKDLSPEDLQAAKQSLKDEEAYMSSKGAAKFSFLNGAGIIGIGVAVLGALLFQDWINNPPQWMPELLLQWQKPVMDFISNISMTPGAEAHSISFTRLVLLYAAVMAWVLVAQNTPLIKAGWALFKQPKITEENIKSGKITPKTFDINEKNASIKLSALDKELKDINGIVFKHGKSSEVKMTEILNKLFQINNRLKAIEEVSKADISKSVEQLKYITSNLEGMIKNNDLSFAYKEQFKKLTESLNTTGTYLEEGVYKVPKSLKNYENGIMLVRELGQIADDIIDGDIDKDTYKRFSSYYARAVQELTQYANDNRVDAQRAQKYLREIKKIAKSLQKIDHSTNPVVPKQDIVEFEQIIKLLQ